MQGAVNPAIKGDLNDKVLDPRGFSGSSVSKQHRENQTIGNPRFGLFGRAGRFCGFCRNIHTNTQLRQEFQISVTNAP